MHTRQLFKSFVVSLTLSLTGTSLLAQIEEDYGQLSWSYEVVESFDGKIKTASVAATEIEIEDTSAELEDLKETIFVFNKHYDYDGKFLSQNLYIAFKFIEVFEIENIADFLALYKVKIRFSDSKQIFEPAVIHKNYMSLFFIQEKSFAKQEFAAFSRLMRTKSQMFIRMEIEEYKVDFKFSLSGSSDALNKASQTN